MSYFMGSCRLALLSLVCLVCWGGSPAKANSGAGQIVSGTVPDPVINTVPISGVANPGLVLLNSSPQVNHSSASGSAYLASFSVLAGRQSGAAASSLPAITQLLAQASPVPTVSPSSSPAASTSPQPSATASPTPTAVASPSPTTTDTDSDTANITRQVWLATFLAIGTIGALAFSLYQLTRKPKANSRGKRTKSSSRQPDRPLRPPSVGTGTVDRIDPGPNFSTDQTNGHNGGARVTTRSPNVPPILEDDDLAVGDINPVMRNMSDSAIMRNSELPIEETTRLPKVQIVDELIKDLQNPDRERRNRAIWELGQRGDSKSVQPLVDLMIDSDSKQRSLILAALSEIGIRTLKPLNRALAISLQDENPEVRKNAIRDLSRIYDLVTQVSQLLRHAVDDPDEEVRETARYALNQVNKIRAATGIDDLPLKPGSDRDILPGSNSNN